MREQLKQIQRRFNKASKSYDEVACVQKKAAKFLVDKLLAHQDVMPRTVLDAGTGTGCIPELLFEKFPTSSWYLNDIADEMLGMCKAKFAQAQNIYYLPGDMLNLGDDLYDCVISNFALQWCSDWADAVTFLHSKSSHIFAFSTLLDGTFDQWQRIINEYQSAPIFHYPKAEALIELCAKLRRNDQHVDYWLMDCPLSFESPLSFMRYLKSLGGSAAANTVELSNLKTLMTAKTKNLTMTYKLFFGMFRRVSE